MNLKFDIEKVIKSKANLNVARKYHEIDNVERIDIKLVNQDHYRIEGMVSTKNDRFNCYVISDEFGKVKKYGCDCFFCNESSPCAHIGAVLLKINNLRIRTIPYHYPEKKISDFDVASYIQRIQKEHREKEEERRREEEKRRLEEIERKRQLELERQRRQEAFLAQMRKEREERERQYILERQRQTLEWIHDQKQAGQKQLLSIVDSTKYMLYPEVKLGYQCLELSYRIGTEQKNYIVKGLSNLIDYFKNKEVVGYGKNFSIVHETERFDEFSNKQLDFIEKVVNRPKLTYYNVQEYRRTGKEIELSYKYPQTLHDFFELYQDQHYDSFCCEEINTKIPLRFQRKDENLILELTWQQDFVVQNNYLYLLPNEEDYNYAEYYAINRMPLDTGLILQKLLTKLKENDGALPLHPSHAQELYKYILQPIQDYIELEGMDEVELKEEKKVNITLKGDVDEAGDIIFEVFYEDEQGNITFAFNEDSALNYNQELVESIIKEYAKKVENGIAFFDNNNDRTLKFCSEGVLKLQSYCDVYISEALKNMQVKPKYSISVGVRVDNDLIRLDINSDDLPREELSSILSAYRRKKKFYRLINGQMLNIDSEDIGALNELLEEYHIDTKELKKDSVEINKYRMFDLDETTNKQDLLKVTKTDSYKDLMENFKNISLQEIQIPDHYNSILRDYQKEGYRWLHTMHTYNFNGILADDMGLGKTIQVIALLEGLQAQLPSIVVCPASLIYNWEDEVHKFSNNMKVACVVGSKAQRRQIINHASEYDLLVTSYDYMRRDVSDYENLLFEYVILDEAQAIKNQKTKNAESVKQLKSHHRLALTGTPIENTLAELSSIFDFLMPGYLFNYHYFKKKYETPIVKNGDNILSRKLKQMVSPFILRRNKMDVLKELPDKIQTIQTIPFDEDEYKLYLANHAKINQELAEMLKMDQPNDFAILAMLTRLRQLCIEPRMIYENIEKTSSKLNALLELLIQLKENNQKVLVFSAFPSVFEYIEENLIKNEISYLELTGKNDKEDRREMVAKFQNGDVDVFLISLKAGGTGLNLTKASAVIHIDPWWNLSAQNQATDRAHRIGQENMVQVFKLVMKNSIEEKIVKLQEKKKELSDLFVENNEGSISKMTKNEIVELFKMD